MKMTRLIAGLSAALLGAAVLTACGKKENTVHSVADLNGKTIGVQLFDYWTIHSQPVGSAMAFGILMMVVVLNFLLNRLTKGRSSI